MKPTHGLSRVRAISHNALVAFPPCGPSVSSGLQLVALKQRRWQSSARSRGTTSAFKSRESKDGQPIREIAWTPLSSPSDRKLSTVDLDGFDKEEYYRHYLRSRPRRSTAIKSPGAWLQKIDRDACQKLPAPFRERPLDFFSTKSRDFEMAQRCLEAHLVKSLDRDKEELRMEYLEQRPGHAALSWLLDDYDGSDLSLTVCYPFLNCMVHCLVAEGGSQLILEWLRIAYTPAVMFPHSLDERVLWRGAVLRFLVEAEAFWATADGGINLSLATFEYICRHFEPLRDEHQRHDPLVIHKAAAGIWIQKQLVLRGASSTANPKLYDGFIDVLRCWNKHRESHDFVRAELLREHPSRPSGLPAFQYLKRYLSFEPRPEFLRDLLDESKPGFGFLLKTARALDREGHKSKARWVLDVGRKEMPHNFTIRGRALQRPDHPEDVFGREARARARPGKQPPVFDERWDQRSAYVRYRQPQ
ncbi:unnamed protein product [Zymoseptoria tritici ST99CH_1E4]|uniref:Uncharacterized protein n=1 Tax=Zymoseptoria tritici ST99CH_1E4 TaxID=1276532 RepID=A0A2H1GXI5_ZYMTR|nr:unnamed protein product [Zymoseptoria tritici ST99CH_1E4]